MSNEIQKKQPESLKEGIYFNMPIQDYHNDPSISCSGVKNLLDNPLTYWWNSALNPNKQPIDSADSAALIYGKAAHCLLLEPEKFDDEFIVVAPRIRCDSERIIIREPIFKTIKESIDKIKQNKSYDNWFKGGYPEVSIFWQDEGTGLMCRARFDYLSLGFIDDYKTTVKVKDIIKSIANFEYNLQSAIYLRGLAAVVTNQDIFIEGNDEQKEWVKSLAKHPYFKFRFLFQEKTAPYISRATTLACDILEQSDVLFQTALNIYKINLERYGVAEWGSGYDEIEEIKATDMPIYWNMKMDEQTQRSEELPV